jgi:NAD-dependent SIR2 family protein deacetylase
MADTFTCDNCGNTFPGEQLKEVVRDEDSGRVSQRLCPQCLDEQMNQAAEVYGVEGEEKRRAAYLTDHAGESPDEPTTGRRE